MSEPALELKDCVIFFVDVLGSSDLVTKGSKDQIQEFASLLRDIGRWRSDFLLQEMKAPNGSASYSIVPAVTSFSDHVVLSFELDALASAQPEQECWLSVSLAASQFGWLGSRLLERGLLLRGGATVGALCHMGGLVFGPGMVDAYELESKVSIYPRIAVSQDLARRKPENDSSWNILTDFDGVVHLDYFKGLVCDPMFSVSGDGDPGTRLREWVVKVRRITSENSRKFEREGRYKEMQKWVWFQRQIEAAISRSHIHKHFGID